MRYLMSIAIIIVSLSGVQAQSVTNSGVSVRIGSGTTMLLSGMNLTNATNGAINLQGNLSVGGNLANNGTFVVEGEGAFLDNGVVSGTKTIQVKKALKSQQKEYLGIPTKSAYSDFFTNAYVFSFDEGTSKWLPISGGYALQALAGYAVEAMADNTISYDGLTNTGSLSLTATKQASGWFLVGNPYPSPIDWDAVDGWSKSGIENSIYSWNGSTYAVYNGISHVGTDGGNRYLPVAKGFFVKCSQSGGTSFGINNKARVLLPVAAKKDKLENLELIRLSVTSDLFKDESLILAYPDAQPNDHSPKLFSPRTEVPQIYTKVLENSEAIGAYSVLEENTRIPLGIRSEGNVQLTISLNEVVLRQVSEVFLTDKKTGVTTNLSAEKSYAFVMTDTDNPDRFVVHFSRKALNTETELDGQWQIYAHNRNVIIQNKSQFTGKTRISLVNALGQISEQHLLEIDKTQLSIPTSVPDGIYMVRIQGENLNLLHKIIIQ